MRFYAVRIEAIQHTHHALQRIQGPRHGSRQPSRALRVATLYGHLQCQADANGRVQLGLRQLAEAMLLHRNVLRADLRDLQAIGWISSSGGSDGLQIQLRSPVLPPPTAPVEPLAGSTPAPPASADLIALFCSTYNAHKPQGWPSYTPRGSGLGPRLRRAIQQVGEAEAFWGVMTQALAAMPEFWRNTYPRGRSGADCAAALFCADRSNSGLGPEFWHVFTWAAGASQGAAATAQAEPETDLQRADRLLLWDGHQWRGQGEEALYLPRSEKRRLAELLEAAGQGLPGAAAQQYAATPEV
jgi:hypothetical protein